MSHEQILAAILATTAKGEKTFDQIAKAVFGRKGAASRFEQTAICCRALAAQGKLSMTRKPYLGDDGKTYERFWMRAV